MMRKMRRNGIWSRGAFVAALLVSAALLGDSKAADESTPKTLAKEILDATGVKGGLVVHLGCGDGKLTAALRANDRCLVHGLDADAKNVDKAREHIRSLGLYGDVSVEQHTGKQLPYAKNLVALVVSEDLGNVTMDEVLRVLRPGGVAYIKKDGKWSNTIKPRPGGIDEWTHFLHDTDGNAVAKDNVGPPRHAQWIERPIWSRHHDTVPSISALVSSNGRVFSIVDEAPAAIGGETPDAWFLIARDAFSGVLLWKRPMPDWGWKMWTGSWKARFNQPNHIPKRLVAVGDTVYVTLGFNAPLTAIDAATGEILRTYEGTEFTDEILYHDGTLVLSVNHAAQGPGTIEKKPPVHKSIVAIDAESGKQLWKTGDYVGTTTKTGPIERVTHLLLTLRGGRIFLLDRDTFVCLDLKTGKELWRSPRPENNRYTSRYEHLMSGMSTLVATDDVMLYCQLEPIQKRIGWGVIKSRVHAVSAATGEFLWDRVCGNWGHFTVPDLFVARGLVWVHDYKTVSIVGLDPKTGEQKRKISTEKAFTQGHHHRCYRNRATENAILTGRRGIEYIDLETGENILHHWARGACRFGVVPCNGLIYLTPHPCDCYIDAKLNGMFTLAPATEAERGGAAWSREPSTQESLEKGPAYGKTAAKGSADDADWPTFRHDPQRSGSTESAIPTKLAPIWEADLGGPVSAATVADGRIFVASVDAHQVHALDATRGKPIWTFTAGGRVDTPPTIHDGLALFGSADGWVYCLRAADGALVWRFRAAPEDRRIVAFGRVESAWPVHGSVLVVDGVAHCTAGRSSFLDGGIYAYSLDPKTGKLLSGKCICTPDPKTGEPPEQTDAKNMDGALSDVLVSDGRKVYMRQMKIADRDGDKSSGEWIRSTAGMLDDCWFNRTGWTLGKGASSQLLVFDDGAVCGIQAFKGRNRSGFFFPGQGYQLFANKRKLPRAKGSTGGWKTLVPIRAVAMVLAGKTLFVAGPPDTAGGEDPWAALEGRKEGALWAVSMADGKKLVEYPLDSPPVFNGIAAAGGRLYLSTKDGKILCYGGR